MSHGTDKAVKVAIAMNACITILKGIAAILSRSPSMMNETIHSFMDTLNQCFLLYGIHQGRKPADSLYAYGHGQRKYMWNLWSAIGLFSIGAAFGLYHSWHAYSELGNATGSLTPEEITNNFMIAISVLGVSIILEGYSFKVAIVEFLQNMKRDGHTNPFKYITKSNDPTLLAIVLEDTAAMLGLVLATIGITATYLTSNPLWDIVFSASIALMLGGISFFLGKINIAYLIGKRDEKAELELTKILKEHPMIAENKVIRSIIMDDTVTIISADLVLHIDNMSKEIDKLHAQKGLSGVNQGQEFIKSYIVSKHKVLRDIEKTLNQVCPNVKHINLEFHCPDNW